MREGIATLQSLYERAGRSFSDGPSPSGAPCRTVRQGRERRPSVGPEVPSYPPKADSHATGRDNSSDVPSPRGALGKPCPILSSDLAAELDGFARVTRELRCDVDHERDKRRRLEDIVRQLGFDHERSRANNAVALLENERRVHSLSNELATARQEIAQYHGKISSLHDQISNLVRDNKNLKEILENNGYLRRSKKPRTERTDEDVPRKT
ncbi:unnamed protein product [Peronospora effusa]|nr:unnamed protein product [Peronospora effusa]